MINEQDWMDTPVDNDLTEWNAFWERVEEYAAEIGVNTRYIEEEFIIDGTLVENYKTRS